MSTIFMHCGFQEEIIIFISESLSSPIDVRKNWYKTQKVFTLKPQNLKQGKNDWQFNFQNYTIYLLLFKNNRSRKYDYDLYSETEK